jgi:hypothetical protein
MFSPSPRPSRPSRASAVTQSEIHALKAAVRERDGFRCAECGMTNDAHLDAHGASLHVHRLCPGARYAEAGCVTLCASCHGQAVRRQPGEPDLEASAVTTPRVVFHLPPELLAVIDAQRREGDRTRTAEIVRALKAYYHSQGCWPPALPPG